MNIKRIGIYVASAILPLIGFSVFASGIIGVLTSDAGRGDLEAMQTTHNKVQTHLEKIQSELSTRWVDSVVNVKPGADPKRVTTELDAIEKKFVPKAQEAVGDNYTVSTVQPVFFDMEGTTYKYVVLVNLINKAGKEISKQAVLTCIMTGMDSKCDTHEVKRHVGSMKITDNPTGTVEKNEERK